MAGKIRSRAQNILSDNYIARNIFNGLNLITGDRTMMIGTLYFLILLVISLAGPELAPYEYDATLYGPEGQVLRAEPPSAAHPLGTNDLGQDVLSRLLVGARPTMITGLLGGTLIVSIGLAVGVTAGYVGGWVEDILMRLTDFVYGIPLIPFAIALLAFLGIGHITSVLVIGLVLWRGSARVLRSQVLQIKERPFILSAKATGASTPRIIVKHILPNVASMAILYFALGVGYSIIIEAGLSFVGVVTPFVPSWGIMMRNAYESGLVTTAWWWAVPPGLMISLTVYMAFMFGRKYETRASEGSEEAFVEAG